MGFTRESTEFHEPLEIASLFNYTVG